MNTLGNHLLGEFLDCSSPKFNDVNFIRMAMTKAAVEANATVVQCVFHEFNPVGVSGVVVIAESHIAIHTWPELSYAAIDVFTCGNHVLPWKTFESLKLSLKPHKILIKEIKRGDLQGYHNLTKKSPHVDVLKKNIHFETFSPIVDFDEKISENI